METKTKIIGRRCGGCGRITPEVEYQAMKNTMDCPNPRCSDPKRAYAEKVLWSGPPNAAVKPRSEAESA